MAIAWTAEMRTGSPALDHEQSRIVGRSNELIAVVASDAAPADVDRALRSLGNAVLRHFSRDEDCAVRDGCPALELNGQAHAEFISLLGRFRVAYERGDEGADVADELAGELGVWVARYLPGPFADRLPCVTRN